MEDLKDVEIQLNRRHCCWYQTCCCLWLCWMLNIQQWLRRTEYQRRGRPASAFAISRCERWEPPSPSSLPLPVCFPSLRACPQAPWLGRPQAKATARLSYACYKKILAWFRIYCQQLWEKAAAIQAGVCRLTLFGPFSISFVYVKISRSLGEKWQGHKLQQCGNTTNSQEIWP